MAERVGSRSGRRRTMANARERERGETETAEDRKSRQQGNMGGNQAKMHTGSAPLLTASMR